MDKDTKPNMAEPNQSPIEKNNLTDDGELQEDELNEVNGGSSKLLSEMLSNVQKTRAEISQTFARNARA